MRQLTGFTDQPRQASIVTIDDGSRATLLLEYKPNQNGWFFSITREDFVLNGVRLVPSPNILRQWKELLPFGLLVATTNNAEPFNQSDFADGFCELYLLDADEVEEVEAAAFPGNASITDPALLRLRFRPVAPVTALVSFASKFGETLTKCGFSGYDDGSYDAGNPTAWNGYGKKWLTKTLSGELLSLCCSGISGIPIQSAFQFRGALSYSPFDCSTTDNRERRNLDGPSGTCGSPLSYNPWSAITDITAPSSEGNQTDFQAQTTLEQYSLVGPGLCSDTTSQIRTGTASETLEDEDTVSNAIDRAGPTSTGTDDFAFTGIYGTTSPESTSSFALDEGQSVDMTWQVIGAPLVNYRLRIFFINTVRSTEAPLAESFLDVFLTTDSNGEWSDVIPIPEPSEDRRREYSGVYEITIA